MSFRLMFIILLLLIAPSVCSNSAYADAVTIIYTETDPQDKPTFMKWEFRCSLTTLIDCRGGASQFDDPNTKPEDQRFWLSSVSALISPVAGVEIKSQHRGQPHLVDIQNGEEFIFSVTAQSLFQIPQTQGVATQLTSTFRPHPAAGGPHHDFYTLSVSRSTTNELVFTLTSQHVPEPATMFLLGTGLAGVAIKTRKRLKNRKSG